MHTSEQKQVFDSWLADHKGLFFKVVRAYAFTPHDQDDLFQEICVQIWQSIPDFRGEAKASTWIYRVALYTAMAWSRGEKKHHKQTQPLASVEHTLLANERAQDGRLDWLYEQIGQLNTVDRSLCLLMLDGYSYNEMAELIGISASNVGVKIHRIKLQLTHAANKNRLATRL